MIDDDPKVQPQCVPAPETKRKRRLRRTRLAFEWIADIARIVVAVVRR
jgi:hypothetical protein